MHGILAGMFLGSVISHGSKYSALVGAEDLQVILGMQV